MIKLQGGAYLNKKKSIIRYFATIFICLVLLPVIVTTVTIDQVFRNQLIKNTQNGIDYNLSQISLNIEKNISRLSHLLSNTAYNYELLELLKEYKDSNDYDSKTNVSIDIDSKLRYLFYDLNEVESIIFFYNESEYYYYKGQPIVDEAEIRKMNWYLESLNSEIVNVYTNIDNFTYNYYTYGLSDKKILSMAIKPIIAQFKPDIEVIYFAISSKLFESFYSNLDTTVMGDIFIADKEGVVISSNNNSMLSKNVFSEYGINPHSEDFSNITTINGQKKIISLTPIMQNKCYVMNIVDYDNVLGSAERTSLVGYFMFFIILVLFFGFCIIFFKDILNPANRLILRMKSMEEGDFTSTIPISSDSEIWLVAKTFNKMTKQIVELMKDRDLKEEERHRLEIETLQYQINPHFLINTLNSIKIMAAMNGWKQLEKIMDSVMRLLSATLGKDGVLHPISAELSCVEDFVHIMKLRYGNTFDVIFDIDNLVYDYKILKLLIQPIIENSIFHGINDIEHRGVIHVRAYLKNEKLVFEIEDNGKGITSERQKEIFDRPTEKNFFRNIGLPNVNSRVLLNYGPEYGVYIDSVVNEYTTVKIVLPVIESE